MKCYKCKHYIETVEYNECKLFGYYCFIAYNDNMSCPGIKNNYKMTRGGKEQYSLIKNKSINFKSK